VAKLSEDVVPYRWIAPLLAVAGAVLVPWALVLAFRLPARHTSEHWDVAWVGFDIVLACALAATAWGIARRTPWAPSAAIAAATLLLCDAWFDNVLARGSGERLEAALEAAFVEVPLAIFCVWLALHCEHVVAALLAALRRRPGRPSADARLR
jgi:hypothetical protein